MQEQRFIENEKQEGDDFDSAIRPQYFAEFIGQETLKKNLQIFIQSAKQRNDCLDHVLLYGPPGLGKTTLAQIIAKELGVNFRVTSGPLLSKAGDLAAILTSLGENDVLFIDEIHRLNAAVEEVLYPAMEDFNLDIIIGEGPAARIVRINLKKFTLVGATTRLGLLTNPLRDRFGIPTRLNFYEVEELEKVLKRGAEKLFVNIDQGGLHEIAKRSRGTPRIALRMLRRIRDFAVVAGDKMIDAKLADESLHLLEVDNMGLDSMDHRYLRFISDNYQGGPVGIDTIAAGLSEQRDTLEETVEPYLLQKGFINRTPRGRMLTLQAFAHLGIEVPKNIQVMPLFDNVEDL